jgi:hypothetical protein
MAKHLRLHRRSEGAREGGIRRAAVMGAVLEAVRTLKPRSKLRLKQQSRPNKLRPSSRVGGLSQFETPELIVCKALCVNFFSNLAAGPWLATT